MLSQDIPDEIHAAVYSRLGLKNHTRAKANIGALAGYGAERTSFARLAVLFPHILPSTPAPDSALNNFTHFAEAVTSRLALYEILLAQPRQLELLFRICGSSNYLSHTLRRNPELFDWLTSGDTLVRPHSAHEMRAALAADLRPLHKRESRLRMLRRFRNRETLRIGVRDLCLGAPFQETVEELSNLADALIQASVDMETSFLLAEDPSLEVITSTPFMLFAFGKLGGAELNYSSDIDLAAVYDAPEPTPELEAAFTRLTEGAIRNLDRNTEEGYVYRIDMRLRPHGRTAPLVINSAGWLRYYEQEAALWELQALLKVRPVAGNIPLGRELLTRASARLREPAEIHAITNATEYLRNTVLRYLARAQSSHQSRRGFEVKNGPGGIRDIEFGVQMLQRIHAPSTPDVLSPATLDAIARMHRAGIIKDAQAASLSRDYVFLRRVEHLLQIADDQQLHILKDDPDALAVTAALLPGAPTPEAFREELLAAFDRSRAFFLSVTQTG